MSDLNRLEDETRTETPNVTPAETNSAVDGAQASLPGLSADPSPGAEPGSDAPRKKRRRGTRGGQRRKKPAGAGAGTGGGAAGAGIADDDDTESLEGSEDWTAETADRGLTDDDIAEQAREDAGLVRPVSSRPKIGDSRPAPPPSASETTENGAAALADGAPKKRRRRRGGRGRSKGGQGGAAGAGATAAPTRTPGRSGGAPSRGPVQYVDAGELGSVDVDGTALLDSLDS
jgi:hypothetical protein